MGTQIDVKLLQDIVKITADLNDIVHKIQEVRHEVDRNSLAEKICPLLAACDTQLYRPIIEHLSKLDNSSKSPHIL